MLSKLGSRNLLSKDAGESHGGTTTLHGVRSKIDTVMWLNVIRNRPIFVIHSRIFATVCG